MTRRLIFLWVQTSKSLAYANFATDAYFNRRLSEGMAILSVSFQFPFSCQRTHTILSLTGCVLPLYLVQRAGVEPATVTLLFTTWVFRFTLYQLSYLCIMSVFPDCHHIYFNLTHTQMWALILCDCQVRQLAQRVGIEPHIFQYTPAVATHRKNTSAYRSSFRAVTSFLVLSHTERIRNTLQLS